MFIVWMYVILIIGLVIAFGGFYKLVRGLAEARFLKALLGFFMIPFGLALGYGGMLVALHIGVQGIA